MIAEDSPLRKLPPEIDQSQTLFFDGIRHAAEIIDFAFERLTKTLTGIATSHSTGATSDAFTSAFLDAWAVVDAIDRLRGLLKMLPGMTIVPDPDGQPGFDEGTKAIRDVRNVADHLATRIPYVLAKKSTALGVLSWFTLLDERRGLTCAIVPGTMGKRQAELVNPIGKTIRRPTGLITLAAGEYSVCLSDAVLLSEQMIRQIEGGIVRWLQDNGLSGQQVGADLLLATEIQFKEGVLPKEPA